MNLQLVTGYVWLAYPVKYFPAGDVRNTDPMWFPLKKLQSESLFFDNKHDDGVLCITKENKKPEATDWNIESVKLPSGSGWKRDGVFWRHLYEKKDGSTVFIGIVDPEMV